MPIEEAFLVLKEGGYWELKSFVHLEREKFPSTDEGWNKVQSRDEWIGSRWTLLVSNWNGFVIVESFHISTAYPHTHLNPNPHPHLNHPQRANHNCLFCLLSLYYFRRKKKRCVCSRTLMKLLAFVGKKSMKQSTNGAPCWLLAVGFFLVRNKNQHSQ